MEIPDYGPLPDPPEPDDDDEDMLDRPQTMPPREIAWYRYYAAIARDLARRPLAARREAVRRAANDGMPDWMLLWLRDAPDALARDLERAADALEAQHIAPPDGAASWADYRFRTAERDLRRDDDLVAPTWALDRWW